MKSKDLGLSEREENLETLTCESAETREDANLETLTHKSAETILRLESTQTRIQELLLEKDTLVKKLKLIDEEIIAQKLIKVSVTTGREHEVACLVFGILMVSLNNLFIYQFQLLH